MPRRFTVRRGKHVETDQQRRGLGADMGLDDSRRGLRRLFGHLAAGLEHRVRLADARRRAEEDLQLAPLVCASSACTRASKASGSGRSSAMAGHGNNETAPCRLFRAEQVKGGCRRLSIAPGDCTTIGHRRLAPPGALVVASSSRFTNSTLTCGSPRMPKVRPAVCRLMIVAQVLNRNAARPWRCARSDTRPRQD